jgi:hypothetical protein
MLAFEIALFICLSINDIFFKRFLGVGIRASDLKSLK